MFYAGNLRTRTLTAAWPDVAGKLAIEQTISQAVNAIKRLENHLREQVLPEAAASAGDENDSIILADFEKKLAGLELSDNERLAMLEEAKAAYQNGFVPGYELLIDELRLEQAGATLGQVLPYPLPHPLQSSVMLSRDIPEIRKYYVWWSNTAFTEGWALYAEYLAGELGLYEDDYAQFGRLAGELWRACRLVVNSGLHLKQWARTEAIAYLNKNTASSEENNARAVDRYLAVPGQATAFKIGMQVILNLRAEAEQHMGTAFDAAAFHALVLENGPLPLLLLRDQVEAWMEIDSTAATP